jgi:hypothetical protein
MLRLDDLELKTNGTRSAHNAMRAGGYHKMDIVSLSLIQNGHVTGFFTGARYVEQYGTTDVRKWWQKIIHRKFTVEDHAGQFAFQFMQRFPSLSLETAALIRSAAQEGFRRGYAFRLERNKWDITEGVLGSGEVSVSPVEPLRGSSGKSVQASSV